MKMVALNAYENDGSKRLIMQGGFECLKLEEMALKA